MPMWLAQISGPLVTPGSGGGSGSEWDLLTLVFAAGPVVKLVLFILFAFSVISWAIIIGKFRQLRRARNQDALFWERFWAAPALAAAFEAAGDLPFSPAAAVFQRAYLALFPRSAEPGGGTLKGSAAGVSWEDTAQRVLARALQEQTQALYRSLTFLATCGNTAPFIGLFGTVWGIMTSFHAIGLKGAASVATVAPGIAEALIATAVGLAAAIPAVVAYNYFLGRARRLEADLTAFADELLPLLAAGGERQA
jgi:biopolymer transport protein TolQ